MQIRYLHTMVRVKDLEKSQAFFELLGLKKTRHYDSEQGRFTLIFMAPEGQEDCPVELTYNWDGDDGLPSDSRHFGHLAYEVENIYDMCQHLMDNGVTINRPPRDGRMAFVRSPDNISIELLQMGDALAIWTGSRRQLIRVRVAGGAARLLNLMGEELELHRDDEILLVDLRPHDPVFLTGGDFELLSSEAMERAGSDTLEF